MSTRILLVDDDTALSEMVGMTLESGGYDVVYCADGTHALQAFTINQPELVLLDLMLPGMDGIESAAALGLFLTCPLLCSPPAVTPRMWWQGWRPGLMTMWLSPSKTVS